MTDTRKRWDIMRELWRFIVMDEGHRLRWRFSARYRRSFGPEQRAKLEAARGRARALVEQERRREARSG